MRRAATAIFLGGWIGFLSVSAAVPALVVLHIAEPGFPVPPALLDPVEQLSSKVLASGNGELLVATGTAVAAGTFAAALGLALWQMRKTNADDHRLGERLAFGALACTGALVAAVRLAGSSAMDAAGSLPSFALLLILSAAAILFDRMLDRDEEKDETDDEGFRAAMTLIGQEMARDDSRIAHRTSRDPRRDRL